MLKTINKRQSVANGKEVLVIQRITVCFNNSNPPHKQFTFVERGCGCLKAIKGI